jgi:secreted trypsin-like serine protease
MAKLGHNRGTVMFLSALAAASLIGCAGAEDDIADGTTMEAAERAIINGTTVTGAETRGVVNVASNYVHNGTINVVRTCTGTLLSNSWILTAAHCLTGYGYNNVDYYGSPATIEARHQTATDQQDTINLPNPASGTNYFWLS